MFDLFQAILLSSLILDSILKYSKHLLQPISKALPQHSHKKNTPTLGGISFIVPGLLISQIYCASSITNFINLITASCFLVGLLDDLIKILSKKNAGLKKRYKFMLILLMASVILLLNYQYDNNYWVFLFHLGIILITTASYDLTDGLDGLLICIAAVSLSTFAFLYPLFTPILLIYLVSIIPFLLFNLKPAQIFMGDSGSLALGGLVASLIINSGMSLDKTCLILLVPLVEFTSVALKLILVRLKLYHKFFKAPIHHFIEEKIGEAATTPWLVGIALISNLSLVVFSCL